jgi:hypothetical protein
MANVSWLAKFLGNLSSQWISPEEVRAEAWALGCRHAGQVEDGARRELRDPGLPARRAILLKAVIRGARA